GTTDGRPSVVRNLCCNCCVGTVPAARLGVVGAGGRARPPVASATGQLCPGGAPPGRAGGAVPTTSPLLRGAPRTRPGPTATTIVPASARPAPRSRAQPEHTAPVRSGPQTDTSGAAAPRSAARSGDPIEPVIHGRQAFVGTRSVHTEPADRGVRAGGRHAAG